MIYVAAGVVVFFGIFVYVLFMIFLPEWVGITGKTALKNEQDHLGVASEELEAQKTAEQAVQQSTKSSDT